MAKRTDNFQKFVKQKKGSAIKEEIKQQKRKEKKERAAAIEAHFEKKRTERQQRLQIPPTNTPAKKSRPNKYPKKEAEGPLKTNSTDQPNRVVASNLKIPQPGTPQARTPQAGTPQAGTAQARTLQARTPKTGTPQAGTPQPRTPQPRTPQQRTPQPRTPQAGTPQAGTPQAGTLQGGTPQARTTPMGKKAPVKRTDTQGQDERGTTDMMPLNKFVAHGGFCSRRDAAIWVKEGKVTVNGAVVTDPGMKVTVADTVKIGSKKVIPSKNFVYILLNKPKDYITTAEDPQGRKTVLDLVRTATDERVYPVGRLDRNTSGVLLLTNDGDLAQKLSHPKHEIKKVYEVRLDRALTKGDMDKIASGVTLEDGFVAPDVIAYADAKDKSIIGVEIHSGRNRIVRRIFEYMKYDVKGLDRVMFAGLTKKDVQRGKWRLLKEKEIRLLKFMNQSFVKVKE